MNTEQEIKAALLAKATSDAGFRARLVADPRATFEQEFDIVVPEGYRLHVHEETATSAHLVLPRTGNGLDASEMSSVSGGTTIAPPVPPSQWNWN